MNVYVLGAGVSKSVGYPLGAKLFHEIDHYVQGSGNLTDRFDHKEGWEKLHRWLKENANPIISRAYTTENIEHLFTALDFTNELYGEALLRAFQSKGTSTDAAAHDELDKEAKNYTYYRGVLLWALEHFFAWRHTEDYGRVKEPEWEALRALGNRLTVGDVVITFNYDATLERVLLEQGKWSPRDGFGFEIVFQKSSIDKTTVDWEGSGIVVLHLHGATGWYRRPVFSADYPLPTNGGAVPWDAMGPASADTDISLDPQFLKGLDIFNVDACLPNAPIGDERHVVLHPSFLKDYETEPAFLKLWQRAAQALRDAEQTYIVGYSLPKADAASLTLLLTNRNSNPLTIVNPNPSALMRLHRLFYDSNTSTSNLKLEDWVGVDGSSRDGSHSGTKVTS